MDDAESKLWGAYWADRSDGNRNAVFEHYLELIRSVASSCVHAGGALSSAEALSLAAQRVLESAIPGYNPSRGTATTWIYGHARRAILEDARASAQKSSRLTEVSNRKDIQSIADMHVSIDPEAFDELVAPLGGKRQRILRMYYVDGLSEHEIAQKIGKTDSAVSYHIRKARAFLKQVLLKKGNSPDNKEA